jgi:hypothetical protein
MEILSQESLRGGLSDAVQSGASGHVLATTSHRSAKRCCRESQVGTWARRFAVVATVASLAACSNNQNIGAVKPLDTPYSSNSSIVRAVQIALREQGYYAGYVTGFMGQSTAFGIERFQIEHCQRVKPIIDDELLQQLGIEPRSSQRVRTHRLRHPAPLPSNTSSNTNGLSEPPAPKAEHPD